MNYYAVSDSIAIYGVGETPSKAIKDAMNYFVACHEPFNPDKVELTDKIDVDKGLFCVRISEEIHDYVMEHGGDISLWNDCSYDEDEMRYVLGISSEDL